MKGSEVQSEKMSRVTAFSNLFARLSTAVNGNQRPCPLWSLEVTAGTGSDPPDGVSVTAIAVTRTSVEWRLDTSVDVGHSDTEKYPRGLGNGLREIVSRKYSSMVRPSAGAQSADPEFFDYQNQVFSRLTESCYRAWAEITLNVRHDGYLASDILSEICNLSGEPLAEMVTVSVLSRAARNTARMKQAVKAKDFQAQSGLMEAKLDTAVISSGILPLLVWLGVVQCSAERLSVTNHGQTRLNVGMTIVLDQTFKATRWSGVPVIDKRDQSVARDDCDEDSEEDDGYEAFNGSHLAQIADNCVDREKASTQRSDFLDFCNEVDASNGQQYTQDGWDPMFVYQLPTGHGQLWLRVKLVGLMYMLSFTHPFASQISLDELYWHIVRSGGASDTGDFPKATDKPFKIGFVQLLYAAIGYLEADSGEPAAAELWTTFRAWCAKANKERQKVQLHHEVWYMFQLMRCRGKSWLTLKMNPINVGPLFEPYFAFVVDDYSFRIGNNDLSGVMLPATGDVDDLNAQLCTSCGLHTSIETLCGNAFVRAVMGDVISVRVRETVTKIVRVATHPETALTTTGAVFWDCITTFGAHLDSPMWAQASTAIRAVCPQLIPGYVTHPLVELLVNEVTQVVPPTSIMVDIFEVWPAMVTGFSVYSNDGGTIVILSNTPIDPSTNLNLVPNVSLMVQSSSCSPEEYDTILLSLPVGQTVGERPASVGAIDENFILQRFCSLSRQAAGVVFSCAIGKRAATGLSAAHDELANRLYPQRLKPSTTSTSKSPLLLSTVAHAGFTHVEVNAETGDFQLSIILAVPVVGGPLHVEAVHVFYLVFDASDKYVKIFAAPAISVLALLSVIDASNPVEVRRAQLKDYAVNVLFPQAVVWRSAMTVRRRHVPELTVGGKQRSNWDIIRQCGEQQLFGSFVEGSANVVDVFVDLLKPAYVQAAMLYEGVLQWAGAFYAFWNVEFGQNDEALWSFIKTKEDQLRRMTGMYAVAEAGFKRITQRYHQIEADRLNRSEQLLDLSFFSDSSPVDALELARGRKQSLDQILQADELAGSAKRLKPIQLTSGTSIALL